MEFNNNIIMFALFLENIPMLFFSLPLIAAASVVFAGNAPRVATSYLEGNC
jgi:uncharacterized membrane-anchored protein YitT (DUF2179 family)